MENRWMKKIDSGQLSCQRALKLTVLLALLAVLTLGGCTGNSPENGSPDGASGQADSGTEEAKTPVIGLILSSEDAKENETVIAGFQEAAGEAGAELLVRIPEVSDADARKAGELTDSFVLCEVDPVEYQMLLVNELVAEDVDVIAIHANHRDALEPVLSAARAVGIRVCAFGLEVNERSFDIYADTADAPEAVAELLKE